MSWKDDYRDHKEDTGLSWADYHDRHFVHVDDLDGATATLEQLNERVEALTNEYRDLKRELHEVRVLLESEEFDP